MVSMLVSCALHVDLLWRRQPEVMVTCWSPVEEATASYPSHVVLFVVSVAAAFWFKIDFVPVASHVISSQMHADCRLLRSDSEGSCSEHRWRGISE